MTAEERFDSLTRELSMLPGVRRPGADKAGGDAALSIGETVFALLASERLVVGLPRIRVHGLVEAGEGDRYGAEGESGDDRTPDDRTPDDRTPDDRTARDTEWFSLDPESELPWSPLAREALEHVRGR